MAAAGTQASTLSISYAPAVSPAARSGFDAIAPLAWPVAALLIALILRSPIATLVGSLGGRITKLSVFQFGIELAPAKSTGSTALLADIQTAASPINVADSSRQMLDQSQLNSPADYAVIQLEHGQAWITSRLYLAVAMFERMRGLRAIVFLRSTDATDRAFAAVVSVSEVRWALAKRYPWLEGAWLRASAQPFQGLIDNPSLDYSNVPNPILTSMTGGFDPHVARRIAFNYIESLQKPGNLAPSDWFTLSDNRAERAHPVTMALLEALFSPTCFDAQVSETDSKTRMSAVLGKKSSFVAQVGRDGRFLYLIDREKILARLAEAES